jgi:hypothetical protein
LHCEDFQEKREQGVEKGPLLRAEEPTIDPSPWTRLHFAFVLALVLPLETETKAIEVEREQL